MRKVERQPTLDDCLAYGRELQANRQQFKNPSASNPHFKPYEYVWAPSDSQVRALVNRLGAIKALAQMQYRAEQSIKQLEFHEDVEKRRMERERKRRERERQDAEEMAEKASPGERINRGLAELRVVAEGKSGSMGDVIKGGGDVSPMPSSLGVDEYRKGRSVALQAARRIEAMVERAKRSPLPPPKLADRDEQLRVGFRGYSPEQIAAMDPSQGLPRQIRERRDALGLDEETGDEIREAA